LLRAAIENERWYVPKAYLIDRGVGVEVVQTRQGLPSAFGVEDLPSNRYGAMFTAYLDTDNMCGLGEQLERFVNDELGGLGDPPVFQLRDFNQIRNLSSEPVLDPHEEGVLTDEETGIRYKPPPGEPWHRDVDWSQHLDLLITHGYSGKNMWGSKPTRGDPRKPPGPDERSAPPEES